MFGSEILDVAIGLMMMFLMLSLVVSSIKEALETVLHQRSKGLERGIREMFGDRGKRTELVGEFYNHPLINSLFSGKYKPGKASNLPSYIPSKMFALAVIDLIASKSVPPVQPGHPPLSEQSILESFERSLVNFPGGSQMRGALEPLLLASGGRLNELRVQLENWFDSSMDRVAGWYKRQTQIIIAATGLSLACLMNIDSLAIVRYLNTNQTARSVLMARVEQYRQARENANATSASTGGPKTSDLTDPLGWLERQGGLPLGWAVRPAPDQTQEDFNRDWRRVPRTPGGWLLKMCGILFTAFAVSLGAPFWFDILNRFMIVRSTVKPEEKSQEEKPKG